MRLAWHKTRIALAGTLWMVMGSHLLRADELPLLASQQPLQSAEQSVDDSVSAPVPPTVSPSPWSGDLWTRSQLSGDWAGTRDGIAESGVTIFGDLTQYYQGVTAGGLARRFEYGGRGDVLIDIDSEKLGLWDGGQLDLRGETRFGQDCNEIDGSFGLSNFAMALPFRDRNISALTGIQYTQAISESTSVFLGKLNLLDGTPATYQRSMRLNYFWNVAMQSNLSRSFLIPSTLGAGMTVRDEQEGVFNFLVLDSHYSPTTLDFSQLFSNGAVFYGEYIATTDWLDLPGHSAFGFLYSTATRTALDTNPYALLQAILAGEAPPSKSRSWTLTYRCDQAIYVDSENPQRRWTLNSDLGLTDGNPNPVRWFANVSLVGTSPLRARASDTIGIGYYHLGVTDLPLFTIHGFGAENGVELFYNIAVSPWFHVTPDIQVLDPTNEANSTSILFGLRARLSF